MKKAFIKSLSCLAFLYMGSPLLAADLAPYTETHLQQIDQSKAPLVLVFHSGSCGTCKQQRPILEALLKEDQMASFSAFRVDFDHELALRKKYRVNAPSTVIVFQNGVEVARSVGETNIDDLRRVLHKGIKS